MFKNYAQKTTPKEQGMHRGIQLVTGNGVCEKAMGALVILIPEFYPWPNSHSIARIKQQHFDMQLHRKVSTLQPII